jgi:hypothetical protein
MHTDYEDDLFIQRVFVDLGQELSRQDSRVGFDSGLCFSNHREGYSADHGEGLIWMGDEAYEA